MQKYLQQAEHQHKQELLDAQSHVQELRDALLKAQAQLQEVGCGAEPAKVVRVSDSVLGVLHASSI
jgi:biotin carboxylase